MRLNGMGMLPLLTVRAFSTLTRKESGMSHQDKDGRVRYNAAYLKLALQWLLGQSLTTVRFRDDCTWSPLHLAATALLWVWSDEGTLVERFATARKLTAMLTKPQQ